MSTQANILYPQAGPFTAEEAEAFLTQPLIAKLATHNADGSIHIAPLWFNYQDGDILFGTQEITHKVANVKRNPRVTVLIDTTEPTLQAVIFYGSATLDYDNVLAKRTALFEKYMSTEQASGLAGKLASTWTPVIIRVRPEHMITFDYTKEFGI